MRALAKKRKKRGIEKVVQYALGHKVRVHILIILNEGIYTAAQIAEKIDQPLNNVSNHLRKMLEDGSIEIADEQLKGNVIQYWYRAVEVQEFTVEEFKKLPFTQRQNTVGAIYQSGAAEVVGGLYAGTLADPRATLFWDWFNLDPEGRKAADELTERYIEEMRELEVEAINRVAKTGKKTTSMLLNTSFFERPRKAITRKAPPRKRARWSRNEV